MKEPVEKNTTLLYTLIFMTPIWKNKKTKRRQKFEVKLQLNYITLNSQNGYVMFLLPSYIMHTTIHT